MDIVPDGAMAGSGGITGDLVLGKTPSSDENAGFDEVEEEDPKDPLQTSAFWERLLDEVPVECIKNQMDIDSKYDLTEKRLKRLYRKFIDPKGPGTKGCLGFCELLKFQGIELTLDQMQSCLVEVRKRNGLTASAGNGEIITHEEFRFIFKRLKMAQVVRLAKLSGEPSMRVNLIEYPEFPEDDIIPQSHETFRPVENFLFLKRDEPGEKMRWVHTEGFDLPTLVVLAAKYQFHPLAIEDALTMHKQGSKIDKYGEHGEHVFCGLNVLQLHVPGTTAKQLQDHLEQPGVAKLSRIATMTHASARRAVSLKQDPGSTSMNIKNIVEKGETQVTLSASYVCVFLSKASADTQASPGEAPSAWDTLVSLRVRHTDQNLDHRFGNDAELSANLNSLSKEWQVPTFAHSIHNDEEPAEGSRRTKGADLFGIAQELRRPSSKLMEHKTDFLLYKIIDRVVDELAPIVAAYTYRLKFFQDELTRTRAHFNHDYLEEIAAITLELKDILRTVRPLTSVLKFMFEDKDIGKDFGPYVEDLRDKAVQRIDDFKELIEHCSHITGQHSRMSDRKMNDTLYVLTIVTTVFIPAQFVTGMYGMNFVDSAGDPGIPELTWQHGYVYFWCLVAALTFTSSCLFRFFYIKT